jgi:2-polyprenyl-3-methyl-5-hydroxy-6-metoxy-1,4-benzoquinol methylase
VAGTSRWSEQPRPSAETYDERWARLEAAGAHPHGEADLVMSFGPSRVLDAGCGTGRVAIELARRGVDVVGVDLDAGFIAAAQRKAPALDWRHDDLATIRLGRRFDVIVLAGNVMIFVAPGTESAVLANLADHLAPGGHLIAGFTLDAARLLLGAFDAAAGLSGLSVVGRFATWERAPFADSDYAVSVLTLTERASMSGRGA